MFQGSLSDVKLPDIIQLMSVSTKTGRFILTREEDSGFIFLREGQIVHAECDDLKGEDAIYSLAIWDQGSFVFEEGVAAESETVTKKNTFILMEVARKFDEWRVLSKKIPSFGLIPELESLGNKKVSFNTQEWHVLSKINGINSIKSIAKQVGMIPVDVAKLIYGLVAAGLVNLREVPKDQPDPNPLASKPKTNATPGKKSPEEEKEWLKDKIEKIYRASKNYMGELAHPVIQRHCAKGVKDVNDGKRIEAVVETASQIVKAAQLLEEAQVAKDLTAELKKIIKEP